MNSGALPLFRILTFWNIISYTCNPIIEQTLFSVVRNQELIPLIYPLHELQSFFWSNYALDLLIVSLRILAPCLVTEDQVSVDNAVISSQSLQNLEAIRSRNKSYCISFFRSIWGITKLKSLYTTLLIFFAWWSIA